MIMAKQQNGYQLTLLREYLLSQQVDINQIKRIKYTDIDCLVGPTDKFEVNNIKDFLNEYYLPTTLTSYSYIEFYDENNNKLHECDILLPYNHFKTIYSNNV